MGAVNEVASTHWSGVDHRSGCNRRDLSLGGEQRGSKRKARSRRSGVECPYCGLDYDEMRTGLTYSDVYLLFWKGTEDSTQWVNKRRHTILGRWHQIKMEMWEEHLYFCEQQAEYDARMKDLEDEVPF